MDHSPEVKINHHSSVLGERFSILNIICMSWSSTDYLRKVSHCFSWTQSPSRWSEETQGKNRTRGLTHGDHSSGAGRVNADGHRGLILSTSLLPASGWILCSWRLETPEPSPGFFSWDGLSLTIKSCCFLYNEAPCSSLFYSCFCFYFIYSKIMSDSISLIVAGRSKYSEMDNHDHFGTDLWQNLRDFCL